MSVLTELQQMGGKLTATRPRKTRPHPASSNLVRSEMNTLSMHRFTLISLAAALGLPACGSSGTETSPNASGGTTGSGGLTAGGTTAHAGIASAGGTSSSGGTTSTGPLDAVIGNFEVELVEPVEATAETPATPGFTRVFGKIYDGASPSLVIWTEAATEGACTLLTPRVPFCNQPCAGGAVCVGNDVCQDYPTARSVGTVRVTGLHSASGVSEFSMTPVANTYQIVESLPYPAFAESEDVVFEASGDFFPAFSLHSKGILPLEVLNGAITLESNKAVDLTWAPPTQAGSSRIQVEVDISYHGGTKGKIECDGPDSGSLRIPAALITKLIGLGVAGFPKITVTRSAVGSATVSAGRIELSVYSDVVIVVQIPGLISCTGDEQCPTGQTCQYSMCK